jgi:transcriptional regulator with XRE-family HTH domain
MDMRRLVGQNVRRIREKKGLTQEQFAEISGFSQQYISGLEQGRRNPTVITLYELAVARRIQNNRRTSYYLLLPSLASEQKRRPAGGHFIRIDEAN